MNTPPKTEKSAKEDNRVERKHIDIPLNFYVLFLILWRKCLHQSELFF